MGTISYQTLLAFFLVALLLSHGFLQLEASSESQPYRTGYHFQPPQNWMNDPNGPMIYKGIYHLFYQWNPKGAVWGNIVWGHSTSTDLINWIPHPIGLYPSQPSDTNGVWTGSATFLKNGIPAILYTGIDGQNQQVQNLAVPKEPLDPYLVKWVKLRKNPLMYPTPENHINSSQFRDPTTAWLGYDGKWRVIIGSEVNRQGVAILYTSNDFVNWTKSSQPLHTKTGIGMWECPDFYPVEIDSSIGVDTSVVGQNVKHVLKVSLNDARHAYDAYSIGEYDLVKDVYTPDESTVEGDLELRYDYGKFYASKTFFDNFTHRRIIWGWINESSSVDDDMKKGWSGIQGVPRTVILDKFGKQLIQWPIKEIERLRVNPIRFPRKVLKGGSLLKVSGITGAQADVEISFEVFDFNQVEVLDPSWKDPQLLCSQKDGSVPGNLGPFGLLVLASRGLREYTAVYFRILKGNGKFVVLMCSDQSRSSLNSDNDKTTYGTFLDVDPVEEKISLRTLIDHSVVESFGGQGKSCITARVYPLLATNENARLYAFNNGKQSVNLTKLSAWSMNSAQIN